MVRTQEVNSGETVRVFVNYPTRDREIKTCIEVDLIDIRAAAPIRVQFDFDANGWRIEQLVHTSKDKSDEFDEWVEVATIPSYHPAEVEADL